MQQTAAVDKNPALRHGPRSAVIHQSVLEKDGLAFAGIVTSKQTNTSTCAGIGGALR